MKLLINYADKIFRKSQKANRTTGLQIGGFDKCISYGPADIDRHFFEAHRTILTQKRGSGYWLWKPYFIRKTLGFLNDGDFLFYCDSGVCFVGSVSPLLELAATNDQDVLVFELDHKEAEWTKRDAFILLSCDSPSFAESKQRLASFTLWRKSEFSLSLADEYLRYSTDARVVTDLENQCGQPNYPGFQDHRHDQSILSLLTKKHGLAAYRDPSQWGNSYVASYPCSPYAQILEHTRQRNQSLWAVARICVGKLRRKYLTWL